MIVLKNGVEFNQLEREIYEYGCKVAREALSDLLTSMDDYLARERNKEKYRDKGKRSSTIKTLMGEVEYSRRVYQCDSETGTGKKEHIYLLDNVLKLNKVGMFSGNLIQLITEAASNESFRKAAKSISNTTGQEISHGGVWNVIQAVGEKINIEEKHQAEALIQECNQGHLT